MFTLTLVTPEKKIVAGDEIEEIFVPGFRGELNILPGHAPLLTQLQPGVLRYRLKGQTGLNYVSVSGGFLQVNPLGVNVLAETAERPEELDVKRAQEVLRATQQRLLTEVLDEKGYEEAQARIRKAETRIALAGVSGGSIDSGTTH